MSDTDLTDIPFFSGLTVADIELFMKSTCAKIKTYFRGARVIESFVPNSNIGILLKGKAQIITLDRFGNESILHALERGAIFGITSAALGETLLTSSVELKTDAVVLWVPYKELLLSGSKLGKIHGLIMKNFLEAFIQKNLKMMQKIEVLSQTTIREKVIVYLIQCERNQNRDKVKVVGRVQLAKELRCHRSALTREIAQMESEGLLECGEDWMRLNKDKV